MFPKAEVNLHAKRENHWKVVFKRLRGTNNELENGEAKK